MTDTDPAPGELEGEEAPEQTDPAVQHSLDLAALAAAKRAYQTDILRRLHPPMPTEEGDTP